MMVPGSGDVSLILTIIVTRSFQTIFVAFRAKDIRCGRSFRSLGTPGSHIMVSRIACAAADTHMAFERIGDELSWFDLDRCFLEIWVAAGPNGVLLSILQRFPLDRVSLVLAGSEKVRLNFRTALYCHCSAILTNSSAKYLELSFWVSEKKECLSISLAFEFDSFECSPCPLRKLKRTSSSKSK